MKKNNPYTPIMIREASGTEPRVYARYEFGREKMEDLRGIYHTVRCFGPLEMLMFNVTGLDDKAIEDRVTHLVKDS